MKMNDKGQRFDTAEINVSKHAAAKKRQRKKLGLRYKGRIPHWVYKIILILIISILGMLIWFNRANLTPANIVEWIQSSVVGMGVGDGYPSKIVGNTVSSGNFKSINKEAVVLSDTALTVLNSTAKSVMARQHSFSAPVMKVNGNRTLIYNLGGKGYQIERQSDTALKTNSEDNVIAGDIAQNGKYVLLTQANGYFGRLTAYTPDGKEQYKYWFSDYIPTAVALNQSGTKAAVTAVSAKEGGLISAVYIIDLKNEKTVSPVAVYSENLMQNVFFNGEKVIAVGDKMTAVISSDGQSKANYDYQGMQLSAYSVDKGKIALGLVPYGNLKGSKVVVRNTSAKETASINIADKAESVSLYGDAVAALVDGKVQIYSTTSGEPFGSCNAGNDAKAVALRDESSVYILGVSEIRYGSIK